MLFLINRKIKHLGTLHKILFCTGKNKGLDTKANTIEEPPLNSGL